MITLRPAQARGHFDHGWLDTRHTFSFAGYQDPAHDQFRSLRVLNEDRVQPGQGFGTHGHRDMEIVTWVLSGALAHKDSSGAEGILVPGDAQHMSAGSGIRHSEYNASAEAPVHFLQIWVLPDRAGLKPGHEQKRFPPEARRNRLALVASREGREGSLTWHQDAELRVGDLEPGASVDLPLAPARAAWVQVARGKVEVEGLTLFQGDGAAVTEVASVGIKGLEAAEVLVFDLA